MTNIPNSSVFCTQSSKYMYIASKLPHRKLLFLTNIILKSQTLKLFIVLYHILLIIKSFHVFGCKVYALVSSYWRLPTQVSLSSMERGLLCGWGMQSPLSITHALNQVIMNLRCHIICIIFWKYGENMTILPHEFHIFYIIMTHNNYLYNSGEMSVTLSSL